MAGLAAEGISFAYGTSKVLDDVSAQVAGGGCSTWITRCMDWLRSQGFLGPSRGALGGAPGR